MTINSPYRLLLVDNSHDFRRSVRAVLELEDYQVEEADSLTEAKTKLENCDFDLALVDFRLMDDNDPSDYSGLEVAKLASQGHVPCIIVTGFPSVDTVLLALRQRGLQPSLAIDFISKEHGPSVVVDAVGRALRSPIYRPVPQPVPILEVDIAHGLARKQGIDLQLSRNQYNLMSYLYERNGAVCSSQELLKAVYDESLSTYEATHDKRLERLIARLREKIEDDSTNPRYIITVAGRGFQLVLP